MAVRSFSTTGGSETGPSAAGRARPPQATHYDAIGSVVGLAGGTKLTDSYSYEAFGNQRARTATSTQPFQYLGNSWDSTLAKVSATDRSRIFLFNTFSKRRTLEILDFAGSRGVRVERKARIRFVQP